ncbi:MAG TPA: TRZ/ATZ family hydrolase, partial [Rudaea sp.]|nr:TRZ/ATZ family hydrolase [Rudaea sp.]
KQADLVAVRLDALETQPLYNAISQIVYATGRHQVGDVWIAGVRKVENSALCAIDTDALRAKTQAWRARIAAN